MRTRTRTRTVLALIAIAAGAGVLAPARRSAADSPLWQRVADPDHDRFDRLVQKARDLLAEGVSPPPPASSPSPAAPTSTGETGRAPLADRLAACEARVHEALALAPFDFSTLFLLAEVQSLRAARPTPPCDARARRAAGPPARAEGGLLVSPRARALAPRAHSRGAGRYEQQLALGEPEAAAYANAAELLMGLGRLRESRSATARRSGSTSGPPTGAGTSRGSRFSYYGLGVALDRDRQEVAAREAMGRAVAMDPTGSLLRLAQQPDADFSFIPDGDVYYYLGLAAELARQARRRAWPRFRSFCRPPAAQPVARARPRPPGRAGAAPSPSRVTGQRPHRRRCGGAAPPLARRRRGDGARRRPHRRAADRRRARAAPAVLDACLADAAPARGHDTARASFRRARPRRARRRHARRPLKLPAPLDAGRPRAASRRRARGPGVSRAPRAREARPPRASRCY